MNKADLLYKELVEDIQKNGSWDKGEQVRTKYADGSPAYTKHIFGKQIVFEEGEIPLLTTKFVGWKTATKEMYLFWVKQTTLAADFEELACTIWREWYGHYTTGYGIGKSYGYQLKKYKQVEELIYQIENNPQSRRLMTSFWSPEDIGEKALQECAMQTTWNVVNGKLELILYSRSLDVALGCPYNWIQYWILLQWVAQATGYKAGRFIHQIGNAHYYDRHEELLLQQIQGESHDQPIFELNKEVNDFFSFKPDDVKIKEYKHNGKFEYEVAI